MHRARTRASPMCSARVRDCAGTGLRRARRGSRPAAAAKLAFKWRGRSSRPAAARLSESFPSDSRMDRARLLIGPARSVRACGCSGTATPGPWATGGQ